MKLQQKWNNLFQQFSSNENLRDTLYNRIRFKYGQSSRAYHNLMHINSMLLLADEYKAKLEDPPLLHFSIWYHDLIYNALRKDNELKSADHAKSVLQKLKVNSERIDRCHRQILLTKQHRCSAEDGIDEKLLLDFDLEILSRNWEDYLLYTKQIRKEYWMFPGPVYRKGRRAAMANFLERDFIYQTEDFRTEREVSARKNIAKELEMLK